MKRTYAYKAGFTLVELLIVIVVIGILAAISIVAYNGIIGRARDSQRAQDMNTIKNALLMYDAENGGVRHTMTNPRYNTQTTAAAVNAGGWDSSVQPNWLAFLNEEYGKMPVDPVNELTAGTNPSLDAGARIYIYHCYTPTAGNNPYPGFSAVRLGYRNENSEMIYDNFKVTECI